MGLVILVDLWPAYALIGGTLAGGYLAGIVVDAALVLRSLARGETVDR